MTVGARWAVTLGDWLLELEAERYMSDASWGLYAGDEAPALVDFGAVPSLSYGVLTDKPSRVERHFKLMGGPPGWLSMGFQRRHILLRHFGKHSQHASLISNNDTVDTLMTAWSAPLIAGQEPRPLPNSILKQQRCSISPVGFGKSQEACSTSQQVRCRMELPKRRIRST